MGKQAIQQATEHRRGDAPVALPSGTPAWITRELIELTQKVWQPYYDTPLTLEDTITILRNAGGLLDALARR
mgnify:CR=1 FL=1|tara:strand:+ start:505 stop:720 length:216 start_codon:yes stop_codon:yes gene_type:complete